MMRTAFALLLAGAALAAAPGPDDATWEAQVLAQFELHRPHMVRIRDGGFRKEDVELIRVLANYGLFKLDGKQKDANTRAEWEASRTFFFRLIRHKPSVDYLAKGGPPRPQDSTIIRAMAIFAGSQMIPLTNFELGR
jgi:hypothetical protein